MSTSDRCIRVVRGANLMARTGPTRHHAALAAVSAIVLCSVASALAPSQHRVPYTSRTTLQMVAVPIDGPEGDWPSGANRRHVRHKHKRKREKPRTEQAYDRLRMMRQAKYEEIKSSGNPSIFSFESLFPSPVWDDETIQKDLYGIAERDKALGKTSKTGKRSVSKSIDKSQGKIRSSKIDSSTIGGSSMMRAWRAPRTSSSTLAYNSPVVDSLPDVEALLKDNTSSPPVDRDLTRLVEDKVYGYRRSRSGDFEYDTSLMGDGAVKFRHGVRLGNALKVNADRLNYHAKKQFGRGRLEEAEELYERALEIDPRDGRAYLGLSRVAQRRRDFKLARECLRTGIARSVSLVKGEKPDRGANPFLLQALGYLEERMGNLSEAEALYISAARSRPSHAAAWVSLAQLRTRKLRQSASAGRVCFQTAEKELERAGLPPSSHVYTAWASLEYKKAGDVRRARELFEDALKCDPKCSPAWLQLGVMEADKENWDRAQECFEMVLSFDQRNSRVLQAYAIMETKRTEGDTRKAIELFERALKANPRDAGVLQAYALFVAKLGDVRAARDLLRRGAAVNKRHAPVWQAWGVLETRHGTANEARAIFQQGIWSCAQLAGGQSGGYRCARLWQAWGVLEAREGDHSAARRCFSRALDADNRNIATVMAWTQMEQEIGNILDARSIFERALSQLPAVSTEKLALWRAYELMEKEAGNTNEALQVYQRSMREAMIIQDGVAAEAQAETRSLVKINDKQSIDDVLVRSDEVEVERWGTGSMRGEVWMNNGSIEGKLPKAVMRKRKPDKNP